MPSEPTPDQTTPDATTSGDAKAPLSMLQLDPENPRLPEELHHQNQARLLAYLEENEALDELAASFVTNGYFQNEPIVTLPPDSEGKRIVVEGNRRVATLLILLQEPASREAELVFDLDPAPDETRLEELRSIPYFEVQNRAQLRAYLGYRHISGLRRWSAEAKARYLWRAVEEAVRAGSDSPFHDVGRLVGSNARGVRASYTAYIVLRHGREQFALDTESVLRNRFGVWMRLLSTANVPRYIGLDPSARDYSEVRAAVENLDGGHLKEVIADLSSEGGNPPVLGDSRDATKYSDIVADERALSVLREYRDLELAAQVVEGLGIRRRIERLARGCEVLLRDVRKLDVDEATAVAAEDLAAVADDLLAVVKRNIARATGQR